MSTEFDSETQRHLDQLFRQEYGRLVAWLVRRLGPGHLASAEDIAQDAMLAAVRTWPFKGMPDNPAAWLQRTASNRAIDLIRRARTADDKRPLLEPPTAPIPDEDELHLLLLCCEPTLKESDRLILALNIAFGFSSVEIARLMFVAPATMAARLTRAKRKFADLETVIAEPSPTALKDRLPSAMKVLYLAFSVGFSPGSGDRAVEEDTAYAALAATERLAANPLSASPACDALAALMCLQASRLAARMEGGRFVPLSAQDRRRWDHRLITRGLAYLKRCQKADELSRYHLEAGIAALHATAPSADDTPWADICRQYAMLEEMTGSAIVALNHAVAMAMSGRHREAAARLGQIAETGWLADQVHFLVAKAELARAAGYHAVAADAYRHALDRPATLPDLIHLEERLASLG